MANKIPFVLVCSLFTVALFLQPGFAKADNCKHLGKGIRYTGVYLQTDTVPPAEVIEVVSAVVYSIDTFNIEAVANLYTPNAIVADDEPPYSWNGPTAGVQWVNAVEKACKDNKITKLKGAMEPITVFQENADNIYLVVPVNYTGNLPGKRHFAVSGFFNFVLRQTNGKWVIKSQAWVAKKGVLK